MCLGTLVLMTLQQFDDGRSTYACMYVCVCVHVSRFDTKRENVPVNDSLDISV
jgi:hypothetical protein